MSRDDPPRPPEWWRESQTPRLRARVEHLPLETLALGQLTLRRLTTARRVVAGCSVGALGLAALAHVSGARDAPILTGVITLASWSAWTALLRVAYRAGRQYDPALARYACEQTARWYRMGVIGLLLGLAFIGILNAGNRPASLLAGVSIILAWSPMYFGTGHGQILSALIGLLDTTPPRVKARAPAMTLRERLGAIPGMA